MTRDLDWGVKVPLPDAEGKVLYVWFDAPIGYISATKDYFDQQPGTTGKEWENYWKKQPDEKNNSKLIHFIGKDNIVFHCIIFPITLLAEGNYILPTNVPANEFLNLEGNKISTSRNWAVWLHEYLEDFPEKQDELRYVLASIAPETKDSEFTWKDYQARVNNELAAILGNFVNRVIVLTHKYYEGKVPSAARLEEKDSNLLENLFTQTKAVGQLIEQFKFRDALGLLMDIARTGNKYLADAEPWKTFKPEPERTAAVINTTLQFTAFLASAIEPFLPNTTKAINKLLHFEGLNVYGKADMSLQPLPENHSISQAKILFEQITDKAIAAQIDKLHQIKTEAQMFPETKPEITFEEFSKMDIRVGTITAAVKVEKADKLLKLEVNLGIEQRTVVSGIALFHNPEHIVGQQVLLLANLAPRKIKGIESRGMILMAQDKDGKLIFTAPNTPTSPGAGVA
jgi:methionyl-tRNA synthetase